MSAKTVLAASVLTAGCAFLAAPAPAYTACNKDGDCWHTDSRVKFPGVKLSFHDDKWGDKNRSNARYHWHDTDADHDWHHGYWANGEWHKS